MARPDPRFMREALRLAALGWGRTSPNPMVGAVVAKRGRVVGRGYHHRAGEAHAEVLALQEAGGRTRGAELYVNLEPCAHQGKTPPCTKALIAAGVSKVVAAMCDPNPLVNGRGLRALKRAGIETEVGLLGEEASQLNEAYVKHITTGRPFGILKCAMTLDGKIATRTGESRWITSSALRRVVHHLRLGADAILTGSRTVMADDPELTVRRSGRVIKSPLRVVLDTRGRCSPEAAVFTDGKASTLLATTNQVAKSVLEQLHQQGVEVLILPEREGRVDLESLLKRLAERGVTSLLVEGGGILGAAAIAAGMVDKVICFIAPKIVGGKDAPTPIEGRGVADMADALELRRVNIRRLGDEVIIQGYLDGQCLPA